MKEDVGPCPPPMSRVSISSNDKLAFKDHNGNGIVCLNPDGILVDDNAGRKDWVEGKKGNKPDDKDLDWEKPQNPNKKKGKVKVKGIDD